MPLAYSEQLIVDTDKNPDVIKLLGYYGDATGGTNIGISNSPLYIGTSNDTIFKAPRLDPGFKTCVGDVMPPVRYKYSIFCIYTFVDTGKTSRRKNGQINR